MELKSRKRLPAEQLEQAKAEAAAMWKALEKISQRKYYEQRLRTGAQRSRWASAHGVVSQHWRN